MSSAIAQPRLHAEPPRLPARPADAGALLGDGARLARLAVGAEHAIVLASDAVGRLTTVAADGPLRLDPVPPLAVPADTVVAADAAASPLVPVSWRAEVRSVAIVPLVVDGVPRGALVAGWGRVRHEFAESDVRLLEAAAAPLAYALRLADAAAAAERDATLLDRVINAGRELAGARTRHAVLQTAMTAVLDLLGGTACSVHVATGDGVETLASHGAREPDPGPHAAVELDEDTQRALRALDAAPDAATVLPDRSGGQHVVVPMAAAAFALVTRGRLPALTAAELAAATAVAAQAWEAYERAGEAARLAKRLALLDAVRALADDPLLDPDMERLLERLAPAVRATTGAELLDAFLLDPAAARAFATPGAHRQVAALLRRWRRAPAAAPVEVNDVLVVPMLVGGQVVGALRVRPGADAGAADLLPVVAAGIGSAVTRVLVRTRIADHERGLAVAEERERVGRDLHDTLGQQLFALRVELEAVAASTTDRTAAARLREAVTAVTQANADLRLAIHALSFLEHAKRGLVPSLRTLVRKVGATTPIGIQLRVVGTPARLPNGREEALFRVAHEALENVVRHSRASTAVVTVSFSPERAAVIVRDDGTGMSARSDEQRGLHFGLRTMTRRMEEIGGGLDVTNFKPHGLCLHAWVPAG